MFPGFGLVRTVSGAEFYSFYRKSFKRRGRVAFTWQPKCSVAARLFADAESAEDSVQNVFVVDLAGDFTDGLSRGAKFG